MKIQTAKRDLNQLTSDWNLWVNRKEVRPGSIYLNSKRFCANFFVKPPNQNFLIHGGANV
jgi:hypothetical protein